MGQFTVEFVNGDLFRYQPFGYDPPRESIVEVKVNAENGEEAEKKAKKEVGKNFVFWAIGPWW